MPISYLRIHQRLNGLEDGKKERCAEHKGLGGVGKEIDFAKCSQLTAGTSSSSVD
jgi:hypothetical protein